MKIAIAGVGAMGSRFGLMLFQAGNDVILIDNWLDNVNAINQDGLKANFNGENIIAKIPAFLPADVDKTFEPELIVLFTKAMQLEGMLQDIHWIIHPNCKILCLLNGIGHEEVIEKYVDEKNVFIGNTMWTSGMEGPGSVKLFGNGSVELKNLGVGQRAEAEVLAGVLSQAKLNAKYSENIQYTIYKKACVNGTMNGLCTLLRCNMATLGRTTEAHKMVEAIVKEFIAVAAHEGVTMDLEEIVAHVETCFDPSTIGEHFPSMYQDLIINHRLTEIDYINGAVAHKGEKYGIPTPNCVFLTQLIHSKEQTLDAK